jgi:plastocyanin
VPAVAPDQAGGSGRVAGRAPAASGGYAAIVILEPQGEVDSTPQAAVPVMDQVQQTFLPDILFVRTGQPTEFRNNDDVLHNVRVREDATRAPAFNVAIPTGGKYLYTFEHDGFYDVGCDIHPGMSAQIISSKSPHITMADAEGHFTFDDVRPGQYKAVVYGGGRRFEKTVTVPATSGGLDVTAP